MLEIQTLELKSKGYKLNKSRIEYVVCHLSRSGASLGNKELHLS